MSSFSWFTTRKENVVGYLVHLSRLSVVRLQERHTGQDCAELT